MLDRKSSPGTPSPQFCLQRIGRRQPGAAPGSYRQDLAVAESRYRHDQKSLRGSNLLLVGALAGCAPQGPCQPAHLDAPEAWTMQAAEAALATPANQDWWRQLNDPAIDSLMEAALADGPGLMQAIARVDEARVVLSVTPAQQLSLVNISDNATRARSLSTGSPGGGITPSAQSSLGLGLSWEIDLFGWVHNSVEVCGPGVVHGRAARRDRLAREDLGPDPQAAGPRMT